MISIALGRTQNHSHCRDLSPSFLLSLPPFCSFSFLSLILKLNFLPFLTVDWVWPNDREIMRSEGCMGYCCTFMLQYASKLINYNCCSSSKGFKEYVVGYSDSESAPPMESSMLNGMESAELAYPLYEPGLPHPLSHFNSISDA